MNNSLRKGKTICHGDCHSKRSGQLSGEAVLLLRVPPILPLGAEFRRLWTKRWIASHFHGEGRSRER